ncbi:MAG: hypothetical protein DME42_02630 [Verrucomicrobia bacterium]|nr:MAG: hypothetical protein DME42_02630 [Verrucomicrobiota bacterium]
MAEQSPQIVLSRYSILLLWSANKPKPAPRSVALPLKSARQTLVGPRFCRAAQSFAAESFLIEVIRVMRG